MSTTYMEITDEESWLEKRKGYITSTQISALFGISTYNTAFELYHISRGNIEAEFEENNFMTFGKIIEQPVCEMVLIEHPDWIIEDFDVFAHDDEDKIGSSFDRTVKIGDKKYLLEIKSISYSQYKEKFTEHAEDDIEASPQYECQMQTELELTKDDGFSGLIMAVFILDTRQLRYIFRIHDEVMGAELRAAAKEFWAWDEQPEPDYARDVQIISRICPSLVPQKTLDATKDDRITELAAQIRGSKDLIKQEDKAAKAASGELMILLKDNHYAWTEHHKITVSDIKPNEGKVVTEEMVGEIQGKKAGYKRLLIKEQTKDKDNG